jgi:hypothetical protein
LLASRSGRFTLRERAPGTHWIGGWVGPIAVLDAVVKKKISSSRRESKPRTPIVQPVAQRYTDWAIMANNNKIFVFNSLTEDLSLLKTLLRLRLESTSIQFKFSSG